jgi:hypothetical protein
MAKRTTKKSKTRASAQSQLDVKTFALTPDEAPILTLDCPDFSSGVFNLTFHGSFVTTAGPAALRARKAPKR